MVTKVIGFRSRKTVVDCVCSAIVEFSKCDVGGDKDLDPCVSCPCCQRHVKTTNQRVILIDDIP